MCGIVGVVSHREGWALSEAELIAMRDRMITRGPDDAGLLIQKEHGRFVGLGHRRLSIIDLSPLGRQPMSTADGGLWIVFNGEIFNFKELRDELSRSGRCVFRSRTDTEVILYGVREWGLEGCLKRLRGMYAFALFDKAEGVLTLVRDPLGVKPLYYLEQPGLLAFASEIKALLAMPGVKKNLNDRALHHYLTFANAPAPLTLFEGVCKLEAGTYLTLNGSGRVERVRYWDPTGYAPDGGRLDEHDYVEELRRLLRQAVARRMVSDVPFGAFLSGGVDSSLNVALMAEVMDQPVKTYSIGIKGDASNEFNHARAIAQRFGTDHHELVIDDGDFLACLPAMAMAQDEPLADPVCVPIYYVSKLARDSGTTVIQVGEGSDELFAGYRAYHRFNGWDRTWYQSYLTLPHSIRSLLHRLARGRVPPHWEDALRRARDGDPLFMGNAIAFWDSEKPSLWTTAFLEDDPSSRYIGDLTRSLSVSDPLLRMINVELKNRLPELLLMRVDKMSMAHSIETRVPYLDEDLVTFALTIPSHLKYKNGEPKSILKKAAEGILPDETIYRRKWGFCGSATNMLSDTLIGYARAKIMRSPLVAERFRRETLEKLFDRHRRQKRFNSFKIWNLLNLVLWYECWFL
jgi:asparagine synthase (glutamine-hydrolysing)